MLTCGIDIGARTTKIVLLDDGRIIASAVRSSGARPQETAVALYNKTLSDAGLSRDEIQATLATGYGRNHFSLADRALSEISCHAKGAAYYFPQAQGVIDIGGQDSKAIRLLPGGKVREFAMNDRCAAGTGRFIEMVAQILDVSVEEAGMMALNARETCEISSMCAVFAESEIIGLLQRGTPPETVLRGVFNSVAKRTLSLMRGILGSGDIVFTGGVANNPGVAEALREVTGCNIIVPDEPTLVGALGAALLARKQLD